MRKAHTSLQICEARVGAKAVPSWFHVEPLHLKRALRVPLFEPSKGWVVVAQTGIDKGYAGRGHIFLSGELFEFVEHRQRLTFLAQDRIDMAETAPYERPFNVPH